MISKSLEATLQRAMSLAEAYRQESATLEHLLLALAEDQDVLAVFQYAKVSIDPLKQELFDFIIQSQEPLPLGEEKKARVTVDFQRVLQRATIHARSAGMEEINGLHLLVSLFAEEEATAVHILMNNNLNRFDVITYISNRASHTKKKAATPAPLPVQETSPLEESSEFLEKYCVHMNQRVQDLEVLPMVGRDGEVHRLVEVLCRQTKNNPLLIGEPGVGKTALVEGLAYRIEKGDVPEPLLDHDVYALDMGALLAGTRFRGDFEERLKGIMEEVQGRVRPAILFIDEVHNIIGSGAVQGGGLDTANLLKPALSRGDIRCIAATTFEEYRTHLQKDSALLRRFQKIEVPEPSRDECIHILEGIKETFEEHHNVIYTPEAIESAVDMSVRYLTDRHLPDKAIDVLDETGSHLRLMARRKPKGIQVVEAHDVADTIGRLANIPSQQIRKGDRGMLKMMEKRLKQKIFGQDQAVASVVSAIKLARSGLRNVEKPMGCFLFSGPTGVGKTEIARQLSETLSMPLLRFDMSEYVEKHSVAKLIGAPPGYIGYEKGGQLTEAVTKNPYAVLLLDEIEKAHPDVYNVLLQVMDHGMVSDPQGRSVNFRHTLIVMTTNAGAGDLEKSSVGFMEADHTGTNEQALKTHFTPEFRNRLDAVVSFEALKPSVVIRIVEKFLKDFEKQLLEKNVSLKVEASAKKWLADKGYDPVFGARPLARLLEDSLKKPLAEEILFGQLVEGGHAIVACKGGVLALSYSPVLAVNNT